MPCSRLDLKLEMVKEATVPKDIPHPHEKPNLFEPFQRSSSLDFENTIT